jgi:hypothetical protein
MGRYWWKAWVIAVASALAISAVWFFGLLEDGDRVNYVVAALRSVNRYVEPVQWSSRLQGRTDHYYTRTYGWLYDEERRQREAKVARLARIELPVEVPQGEQ